MQETCTAQVHIGLMVAFLLHRGAVYGLVVQPLVEFLCKQPTPLPTWSGLPCYLLHPVEEAGQAVLVSRTFVLQSPARGYELHFAGSSHSDLESSEAVSLRAK